MPPDNDREALIDDESWRLVQGLQLLTLVTLFFYMIFFVRYDSPKFYVTQKQDEKAKHVINQIYHIDGEDCTEEQVLNEIKQLSLSLIHI